MIGNTTSLVNNFLFAIILSKLMYSNWTKSYVTSLLIWWNHKQLSYKLKEVEVLTLFRMGFFGAAHGWGRGGGFYNDETWHSYTLPNEDPKNV